MERGLGGLFVLDLWASHKSLALIGSAEAESAKGVRQPRAEAPSIVGLEVCLEEVSLRRVVAKPHKWIVESTSAQKVPPRRLPIIGINGTSTSSTL